MIEVSALGIWIIGMITGIVITAGALIIYIIMEMKDFKITFDEETE